MKSFQDFNNRVRRSIGLLLTLCFFLGVVALALHHHDVSFQLKGCAICKAKTSFSGALNKVKADPPVATAAANHCPEGLYSAFSRIRPNQPLPFIASRLPNPFLNKAPPFLS